MKNSNQRMDRGRVSQKPVYWVITLLGMSLIALVLTTWINHRYLSVKSSDPDFAMGWYAARALLMEGSSPYHNQVQLDANQLLGPELEQQTLLRFSAPLYTLLIYIPFALIGDFNWAITAWMTLLELAAIVLALLWVRLVDWPASPWSRVGIPVLVLVSLPTVLAITQGGQALLAFLALSGVLLALKTGRDELAGVLYIFSSFQVGLFGLALLLVLLWAISQRRWTFIAWSLGTWLVLIVLGFFLVPNWIWQQLRLVVPDFRLEPALALRMLMDTWFPGVGRQFTVGIGLFLAGLFALESWRSWQKPPLWLSWTLSLTLVISIWLAIWIGPQGLVVLSGPLVLVVALLEKRWQRGRWIVRLALILGGVLIPWIWYLALQADGGWALLYLFYLPVLIMLGLYWIRWWMVRSIRLNI
ncbi:MAG: hypothetical protein JW862_04800 [Anaerolineales bacterium]|nr:hypothetical protein [Anaerolineales bacterium]